MSISEDMMEQLILDGSAEFAGIDVESGDMLYNFTSKLQTLHPEISSELEKYFHSYVMKLWEKGFIEMNILDKDPTVELTNLAYDEKALSSLDTVERRTLQAIIEKFDSIK